MESPTPLLAPKPWYRSTTIQGLIVSLLSLVVQQVQPNAGADEAIANGVAVFFQLAGIIWSVYGRLKSTRPIEGTPVAAKAAAISAEASALMKDSALVLLALAALFFGAACSGNYNGPTVSRVGVSGSYTSEDGQTFSGGASADLAYPLPSPRPVRGGK